MLGPTWANVDILASFTISLLRGRSSAISPWANNMIYREIKRRAKQDPDKIIIVGERRNLNYRQLLTEIDACAAYFQSVGIKAQSSVLIGVPPAPEFYVAFFAACAVGATAIPLLPSAAGI